MRCGNNTEEGSSRLRTKVLYRLCKTGKRLFKGRQRSRKSLVSFKDAQCIELNAAQGVDILISFLAALRDKHPAEDLVRSYFKYVIERLKQLTDLGSTLGVSIQLNDSVNEVEPVLEATGDADLDLDDLSSFFEKTASGLVQNALAGLTEEDAAAAALAMEGGESLGQNANAETTKTDNAPSQPNGKIDLMTDYKELEALVAESTSNYVKTTLHGLSPVPYQPTVPTSTSKLPLLQFCQVYIYSDTLFSYS